MNSRLRPLASSWLAATLLVSAHAAETPKARTIDKLEQIDPKFTVQYELKAKVVSSKDPEHPKAIELNIDYAKPATTPNFKRIEKEGFLNPKKHSAIQFWVRGDNQTQFTVQLWGNYKRTDKKRNGFGSTPIKVTPEWKQVVIPLDSFKRHPDTRFENGQKVSIPGGDAPDSEDFSELNRIEFVSGIGQRGDDGMGHIVIHKLELVEK